MTGFSTVPFLSCLSFFFAWDCVPFLLNFGLGKLPEIQDFSAILHIGKKAHKNHLDLIICTVTSVRFFYGFLSMCIETQKPIQNAGSCSRETQRNRTLWHVTSIQLSSPLDSSSRFWFLHRLYLLIRAY